MNNWRSVFVGGVKLIQPLVEILLKYDSGMQAVFSPSSDYAKTNSDYVDLSETVNGVVPYHTFKNVNDPRTIEKIQEYKPTVIYALGISQILKKDLLAIPDIGVLGGHISKLPSNRGSHPIIWAIANGLKQSAVSVIWLDKGVDTGDIAWQKNFEIKENENAGDIYSKVSQLYVDAFKNDLLPAFHRNQFPRAKQPDVEMNVWRRRKYADGIIDWRMSANRIHNLVRALYHPYPGAVFGFGKDNIAVWKSQVVIADENLEPGKILAVKKAEILVKCGEGAIWLLEHDLDVSLIKEGEYFY
jgi:methionyl-tRNA formyltransferase